MNCRQRGHNMATERALPPERSEQHTDDTHILVRPIDGATSPLPPLSDEELAAMRERRPDQEWFWTRGWYDGEREADADLAAGRGAFYGSDEEFQAALDAIPPADADVTGTRDVASAPDRHQRRQRAI